MNCLYHMRLRDIVTGETMVDVEQSSAAMTTKVMAQRIYDLDVHLGHRYRVQVHQEQEIRGPLGSRLGHWRDLDDSENMVMLALVARHKRQRLEDLRAHYNRRLRK